MWNGIRYDPNECEKKMSRAQVYRAHAGVARNRRVMVEMARRTVMISHDLDHAEQREDKQPNENYPNHERLC